MPHVPRFEQPSMTHLQGFPVVGHRDESLPEHRMVHTPKSPWRTDRVDVDKSSVP